MLCPMKLDSIGRSLSKLLSCLQQMMLPKMEVSRKGKKPEELDGVPECGSQKRVVPEHQKKSDGWLTEVLNRMSGVVPEWKKM